MFPIKTAVVTGAARGIGAKCAEMLAQDGYRVIVNYRNSKAEAEKLAEKIGGIACHADVADSGEVDMMFALAGELDILVNNAGVSLYGLLSENSDADITRVFETNVLGAISCCRASVPLLLKKHAGSIINISSMWGIAGASCEAVYSASKAALIGLTKSLAKELGPSGIRVNCVAPGLIKTDMTAGLGAETVQELVSDTPLGRIGTAEDIANLVCFLASEKASFITGQVIAADGGFVL